MELELPRLLAPDLPSTGSSWKDLYLTHSNYKTSLKSLILLFLVTTSPYWDWVIYAPAAFLGCGSHFSGSLSGIEPWFPVTRSKHGSPLYYHQYLIGQTFERSVVGTKWPYDQQSYLDFNYKTFNKERLVCLITAHIQITEIICLCFMHVLALDFPQLSK